MDLHVLGNNRGLPSALSPRRLLCEHMPLVNSHCPPSLLFSDPSGDLRLSRGRARKSPRTASYLCTEEQEAEMRGQVLMTRKLRISLPFWEGFLSIRVSTGKRGDCVHCVLMLGLLHFS